MKSRAGPIGSGAGLEQFLALFGGALGFCGPRAILVALGLIIGGRSKCGAARERERK
jgi:hypothetical protein